MSKISPHEEKMLNLQYQMKQNNHDLQNFLTDLDNWESEIKEKETTLKEKKPSTEAVLPPVRNSLDKKKMKKKVKKKRDGSDSKPKQRISGYDYRSWDKFDVDKACENVDGDKSGSSSGEEYETDEEWEMERKKQAAVLEKDKGNEYFKKGNYENAIECYTKGADLDPTNPLLPANRAMALLKQSQFAAAELDCSVALSLDPLYTKAYLRRGSARLGLKKYEEAKGDCQKVLQLEPQNKKAKSDLELIEKELSKLQLVSHTDAPVDSNKQLGLVKAITKPPQDRSKKPLKRIEIEEVGAEDDHERKAAMSKTLSAQSQAKKDIVERDQEDFTRFTANSPADIARLAALGQQPGNERLTSPRDGAESHSGVKIIQNGHDPIETLQTSDSPICDKSSRKETMDQTKHKSASSNSKKEVKSDKTSNMIGSSSGNVSPRELSVPSTSVQFQADFRQLKGDIQAFYQYFKKIDPSDYGKLFGQFFEADVLLTILHVIQECYIRNGDDCFQCMKCLTSVKRFSMVALFLTQKDKQMLQEIFRHLRTAGLHSESDVNSLAKKYDMR